MEHYHYIIDGGGKIYKGKYSPLDNENCTDGRYAAHCGGGNTGRIGIAICCRKNINTPPTQKQVEAMCKLAAELCITYGLTPAKVLTHAEFGQQNPKTSSFGKIDINSLPYVNKTGISECGSYLRNKILWYFTKAKEKQNG
jgi:N-acetylmuramoyl-L-alanine amidase CwlA